MKTRLLQFLHQHGVSPQEAEAIAAQAEPLELPTRHILLHQGQEAEHFYFLVEGVCHACYLTEDGKAFSKEFYWEQEPIIGFEALTTSQPSGYLLETLMASRVLTLPITLLEQWRSQRHPLYLHLLERQLQFKEHKERFMLMYSPEERYQIFSEHFSELMLQITDKQLASYLGIAATSLSRIKARLKPDVDDIR
ncbi:Crp/Fnr family transcriptional regulator [Photobacterium jeanii]|uniref:Crp/Fnr family transcriptional regulator n=1 Tax=Photobacterium jeanii TaxID=858640 RepID=A0A178KQU3_9GAMM|nr:Crp/Fnr family transcriptional regulator [Photobacterium jeanii]OAN19305.1 Crp/Fnr family transcriptional regulator [Photobacterium jeanii]PST86403.1 Crp/Fnr family transcriptional regulator [Photobacterium jeanii]